MPVAGKEAGVYTLGRVQETGVWDEAELVGTRERSGWVKGLGLRAAGGGPEQLDSVSDW